MLNISNLTTVQPTSADTTGQQIQRMDAIFRKVLITQATFSTLANITVIMIYISMGRAREKFSNYLLCCTALSDLVVSGLSWYSYYASLVSMSGSPSLDDIQVAQYGVIDYSFVLCLGTLLLSALDRWYSVSKPLRHQELTRHSYTKFVILAVWVIAAIPPLIRLGMAKFKYENLYNENDRIFNICFRSILIGLILIIMVVLTMTCIKVTMILRRPCNKVSSLEDPSINSEGNQKLNADKRNARVIKIFIGMIIAFGVTFLPITIGMFLFDAGALDNMEETNLVAFTIFCDVFFFTSSLINPLLTLSLHKDFQRPLVSLITCRKRQVFASGNTFELRSTVCESVPDNS